MAEYELPNGYILTDEEVERRAKAWEDGVQEGNLVTICAGDNNYVFIEDDRYITTEPISDNCSLKKRMRNWNGKRYHSEEIDWGTSMGDELW